MCRILAIKNFDLKLHENIVESFTYLAEPGEKRFGHSPGNGDGWGIGYYKEKKSLVFKSGESLSGQKDIFWEKIAAIQKSSILIVHLRKSSWPKTNSVRNAHPFEKNGIIFAHNGTLYDYKKLLPNKSSALDSEVYFEHVMSFYRGDLGDAFKTATKNLKKLKHSSLTSVISDGKNLFAFRECTIAFDCYTLFLSSLRNSRIICSEKIVKTLDWKLLQRGKIYLVGDSLDLTRRNNRMTTHL